MKTAHPTKLSHSSTTRHQRQPRHRRVQPPAGTVFVGNPPSAATIYDAEGKLLNATNVPAGAPPSPAPSRYTNIQFTYDAFGRCVRRVTQSLAPGSYALTAQTVANLTYDGWSLIEERDENQALRYRYVHGVGGAGELVCRLDAAGNTLYYHYDALGSVTHLTCSAPAKIQQVLVR